MINIFGPKMHPRSPYDASDAVALDIIATYQPFRAELIGKYANHESRRMYNDNAMYRVSLKLPGKFLALKE
jgi:hypothetical protein